jgi:hypothetical protein
MKPHPTDALRYAVGVAALLAPALHSLTDVMEWWSSGFTTSQLWLNYVAFLPMPWLLLGIYALHVPRPHALGLVGALLYGAAFTYFAYTTLYALAGHVPDYADLWRRLGPMYTVHGALMIIGGLMFGWSLLWAGQLPRWSIWLFIAGLSGNLVFGLLPAPVILQTLGSAVRNAGLIAIGWALVTDRGQPRAWPTGPAAD